MSTRSGTTVPIVLHSQSYATGFYEKFGFRISSEEFLEDGIPHSEMTRPADKPCLCADSTD
ncbi:MAG: GNAT family N-acetyltransferase [Bacteroidales bacterium]|nr:GNAT family N-acetyltransferase [Bacteroidales bacterium]